jgi:sulfur carrier protein ThiS
LKAHTIIIEEEMTVSEMLKAQGLDYKLFFVDRNGVVIQNENTILKSGEEVRLYPKVKGG